MLKSSDLGGDNISPYPPERAFFESAPEFLPASKLISLDAFRHCATLVLYQGRPPNCRLGVDDSRERHAL